MTTDVPWRISLALALAIFAQCLLEPPADASMPALGLYLVALALLAWAVAAREFSLPDPVEVPVLTDPGSCRRGTLTLAFATAVAAFAFFGGNLFTAANVSLWLAAIVLFVRALWLYAPDSPTIPKWRSCLLGHSRRLPPATRWGLLLVALTGVIAFLRLYRLDGVPGEPFSDHAEKLLDVLDVMQGQTHVFFPRNTGREFIQFYWTALVATAFGTGASFISLKLGTALIGLFTLPYVYLLGREVGGRRVALFALVLAGASYWLNTISRIGLRFPLYPAFTAPALYYLIRGLRRQDRNDFILAGLFLGLGLHGYSPFRVVPLVMLLGAGLYLLHRQAAGHRRQTLVLFSILVAASLLAFLPLLRYAVENPQLFAYRALTRLTGEEQPLAASAWRIFAGNAFNAMRMFNFDNGEIWVHSVPHRPALDVVTATLFVIGSVFLFARYLGQRRWLDLFLLLAIPLLLMPSILSLAFPGENPSLNRTGGAAVVVFVVAAMALDGIYAGLRSSCRAGWQLAVAPAVVVLLLTISTLQNYALVFDAFSAQFLRSAWNTSDIGRVVRAFVAAGNRPEAVFVVPYPHWVDTRLAGMQSGYPARDFALRRDDLPGTRAVPGNKLFVVKENDQDTLAVLLGLYPRGVAERFVSPLEGKSFWIYSVPGREAQSP